MTDNRYNILSFKNKLDTIGFGVGGCAILVDKRNGGQRYYFIERPIETMYLINGHFFYDYIENFDVDHMELLFKHNKE